MAPRGRTGLALYEHGGFVHGALGDYIVAVGYYIHELGKSGHVGSGPFRGVNKVKREGEFIVRWDVIV